MALALASATELLASHCVEMAERAGADHARVTSTVRSSVDIHSPGDLMTLTAAAATALRGEAALKARQPKEARKNAAITPFERSFSDSHWHANFQYRLEEPNLPFEGELMQCARNGVQRTKRVCVYINKKSQVMIKLKSKHVGGAFSKKIKCVVYGVCDEKSAWPYRKERENSEEVYFGLKTGQGLLEFKCKSKIHKQRWVDGVQSLLRQVNCFEAAKCSLGSLRKVAMILGHWVSEIKDDTKRAVYCALIKLLQDNDLAVKLAASRSLCLHVEDANFSEQSFLDLLPICWDSCFKMVEVVQEFDSKVQILNLISTLIGHVSEVIPYAQKLVQFFQKVWEESSGESLLQIQLLVALRNFVIALGYQSPICYSILLPILQKGIDINSPDSLNLLEDSMALWETTLSYAPMMVPQLLALFPYMVEIIERSFDHLQVAVSIMDSYIILDGGEFLNMHASSVAKILDLIVGNVNDKGLLSILPVIDILVQCFPVEVPPLISSCLQKLVIICLSGGDDRDPSKTAVKVSSAAILARILVMNTTYLAQLTSDSSLSVLLQQAGVPVEDNILLCLIDIWLDKVDHASPMQQKTFGLALSIILTLRMPQVLDKLDLILSTCTSVILGENKDLTEEESSGDMSSSRSQGEETPPSKELRKSQIKVSDPIYQMSLENSTRENLQTCSTLHGDAFNSAISRMHPSALAQVKQALKLP